MTLFLDPRPLFRYQMYELRLSGTSGVFLSEKLDSSY